MTTPSEDYALSETPQNVDWWDRIGSMKWQHVGLAVACLTAFVILCVAGPMCSLRISSTPTTTTTEPR